MKTYELIFDGFSEIVITSGDKFDAILKCGRGLPCSIIEIESNDNDIKLIKRINELEHEVGRLKVEIYRKHLIRPIINL